MIRMKQMFIFFATAWLKNLNGYLLSKKNYRPISILPNFSKIYEWCLYDQIATYFENVFSRYQCGFREDCSAQHCLLALIEKWEKIVDGGSVSGSLLTDLSKAFD